MNKPALALAAQLAARFLQIRRGTWLAIGLAMLATLILLLWASVSLFAWLWGQGKSLADGTPEAARTVVAQVAQAVPAAREALGGVVPALRPEPPPRDVSGTDIGPVARYAGLARSHWHRDGREITVRYEGRADLVAVIDHYAKGFAAQGYVQSVISAAPDGEEHAFRKDDDRVRLRIAQLPDGKVKVTIIAVLP